MRISQAEHVESTTNPATAATRESFEWTRTARVTLLVMAASLLFVTCRCHALMTETNAQSAAVQAPSSSSNAAAPGPMAVTHNVRVVRLSDVEGTVQIVRNKETEFSHAVMNMPLTAGMRIETGPDGRAEIEFEDGSVTRITPNSSLGLAKLTTSSSGALKTTLEQSTGLIYYELRSDAKSVFTVTFGQNEVMPTVNSTFRLNLGSTPPELAVVDGAVRVHGASNGYLAEVPQGKTIEFRPSGSAQYTLVDGIVPNGFDQWNDQRDQQAAKEAAKQTAARTQQGGGSMLEGGWGYGWGDLDAYGGWYPVPGYGMVWQPYGVGPGFDPYGYGSWADIGGLGVSWISGYPWGWLPYQCGGWSYIGSFGWGWMPGGCGFGGIGFGYGGYYGGYGGGYWRHHPDGDGDRDDLLGARRYTNIYSAPTGYHRPVPPASLRNGMNGARPGENIVHVGTPGMMARGFDNQRRTENHARAIKFNGTKIEPLHSFMRTGNISSRNAALLANQPARALRGGMDGRLAGQNRALMGNRALAGDRALAGRGSNGISGRNELRGTSRQMRVSSFDRMRAANAAAFRNRSAFGNHANFGTHGSFHGTTPSFGGGGFHGAGMRGGSFGGPRGFGGGGFHGAARSFGGGFHGGGGGFHGAPAGGGFHGASAGGGFHGGGGGAALGGGGGGSFGGGGGGGHAGGGGGGGHH